MSRSRAVLPLGLLTSLALILIWAVAACGGAAEPTPAPAAAPAVSAEEIAALVQEAVKQAAPEPQGPVSSEELQKLVRDAVAAEASPGVSAEDVSKMVDKAAAAAAEASSGVSAEDISKMVDKAAAAAAAPAITKEDVADLVAKAVADAVAEQAKPAPAETLVAMPEKPFYEGKTLRIIANHPPGGGADLNSRVVARHISRFLPGNPKTVVLNKVGGPSIVGGHFVYNAKPDGLTIGVFTGVNPISQILQPGVQYNLLEFPSLGGLQIRPVAWYMRNDAPYRRLQDAVNKGSDSNAPRFTTGQELICGAGTARYRALKEWLDLPMDIKFGLRGGRVPTMQQLERGDIDSREAGMWYTLARDRPGWQVDDTGKNGPDAFMQIFAMVGLPELQLRHNGEIDVPKDAVQVMDLLTEEQKKIWRLFSIPNSQLYRASFAPPGTPPDILKMLRDAMEQMVKDPEFLADYDKILAGDEVTPTSGEDMMKLYEEALGDAEETSRVFKKFLPECKFPGLEALMKK